MDYEKIYNNLCSSRKKRGLEKEAGYEIHHILPRSMGGGDDDRNLVKLTCREHCIAHKLLTKFVKGKFKYKMLTACKLMYSLGKNSREVEKIKDNIRSWKGKFLILPKYVDNNPLSYFKALNFYGFKKVLLPVGSKEYYNKNTEFTYNRVRSLVDKYKLPYNKDSIIFTEVNISNIGSSKTMKLKDLCQGISDEYGNVSRKCIPCNTEHIGKFNNPVRYKDVLTILDSLTKEVSSETTYSEDDYQFYNKVITLSLKNKHNSLQNIYNEKLKVAMGLSRISPKYFLYLSNIIEHLSIYGSVRLPRDTRKEIMDRCVNMLLSTGYISVKRGCKYYDTGSWLEDMLVVGDKYSGKKYYEKHKRSYENIEAILKSLCGDMQVRDIFQ